MIKLASYKGKGKIGNSLIRLWKNSIFSHCELVDLEGYCFSSSIMDKGVRKKKIDLTPENWDVIELPWANESRLHNYFAQTVGEPYSWSSLIASQFFATEYNEKGAAFCSDWCADALGLPNSVIYSPGTLRELALYLNRFRIMSRGV